MQWYRQHRPDVLIFAHHYNALADFERILQRHGIRVPQDLGVAAVTQVLDGTRFSGLQGNQHLVGSWAVELLVSRIMNRDFGFPSHPRIEMVEMQWVDGKTLQKRPD
jgi:LacI family transcriptional regulator